MNATMPFTLFKNSYFINLKIVLECGRDDHIPTYVYPAGNPLFTALDQEKTDGSIAQHAFPLSEAAGLTHEI